MANFIQSLQAENADLKGRMANALDSLEEFRALLLSDKHQGVQADGTRNDWIATADALRRLEMVRQALQE